MGWGGGGFSQVLERSFISIIGAVDLALAGACYVPQDYKDGLRRDAGLSGLWINHVDCDSIGF